MKKVFVSCNPEEKSLAYAAVLRRGSMPVDPSPILDTLPHNLGPEVRSVVIRESINSADEVWFVGDKEEDPVTAEILKDANKPSKMVLIESAPADPAPTMTHCVSLISKEADGENFSILFPSYDDAFAYMQSLLKTMAESDEARSFKIADDKMSGYVAIERKLVCTAYLTPIS